jgi:hypothetical protein
MKKKGGDGGTYLGHCALPISVATVATDVF